MLNNGDGASTTGTFLSMATMHSATDGGGSVHEQIASRCAAHERATAEHRERVAALWGPEPPYEPTVEDRANPFQVMYYGWIGDFMFVAAREQLTVKDFAPPQKHYRAHEASVALSNALTAQLEARHRWAPYVGAPVRHRRDPSSVGVLRWVGYLQQSRTPGRVMAGIEWEAPPAHRVLEHRKFLMALAKRQARRRAAGSDDDEGGDAAAQSDGGPTESPFHDGLVDGERLFACEAAAPVGAAVAPASSTLDEARATCEGVEDVMFIAPRVLAPPRPGSRLTRDSTAMAAHALPWRAPPPPPIKPGVTRAMLRVHAYDMLTQLPWKMVGDACTLGLPVVLENFVDFLGDKSPTWQRGAVIVALLFVTNVLQSVSLHKYYHISIRAGLLLRSSLLGVIFEKCFTISAKALSLPEMSTGRIVNMVSGDVERANDFCWYAMYLYSAPAQLIVCVGLLYRLVGWCAFAGVAATLVTMPLQGFVVRYQHRIRIQLVRATDQRVKATNELFSGIRIVKFMSWEPKFIEQIERRRRIELGFLKQVQLCRVLSALISVATPTIVIATVFVLYHVSGHDLTPRVVFPTIALLNILRMPFMMIPTLFTAIVQFRVAMQRITAFIECENGVSSVADIKQFFPADAGAAAATAHKSGADGVNGAEVPAERVVRDAAVEAAFKGATTMCEYAAILEAVTVTAFVPVKLPLANHTEVSRIAAVCRRMCRCACCGAKRRERQEKAPLLGGAKPARPATPQPAAANGGEKKAEEKEFFTLVPKPLLHNVSLRIPRGKLTVIIGPTGSAKTTLLEAALLGGAFAISEGAAAAERDVAYVPQSAFIMNGSVRDNIVFFSDYDADRFAAAVAACQLDADVAMLPNGIDTEIGEKGVTLSGGQRARTSLARAVYADRSLYILDDILSALDAHVGERVMADCICGVLKDKTRVLATHQVHVLPRADHIVVLSADGRLAFSGSFEEYSARGMSEREVTGSPGTAAQHQPPQSFTSPVMPLSAAGAAAAAGGSAGPTFHAASSDSDEAAAEDGIDDTAALMGAAEPTNEALECAEEAAAAEPAKTPVAPPALMTVEEKATGSVPWPTYVQYFRACGGPLVVAFILFVFFVTETLNVSSSVWLSIWSTNGAGTTFGAQNYLYVYIALVSVAIVCAPLRAYVSYNAMRRGSLVLHSDVLYSVARAPTSFFDTTPLGRILTRFARDVDQADNDLQMSFLFLLQCFFSILSSVSVMLASQPFVLIALVPCTLVYWRLMAWYNSVNREVRRITNVQRSPLFALLSESLAGRRTIVAYGRASRLMAEAVRRLDIVFACSNAQNVCNRWLGVRLEFLGNVLITSVALAGMLGKVLHFGSTDVGLLSLGLTLAMNVTQMLNWLVRQVASVESDMNSIERILFYTNNIPHEDMPQLAALVDEQRHRVDAAAEAPELPAGSTTAVAAAAAADHDDVGAVTGAAPERLEYRNVSLRYREGLPLVLRGLSFVLEPGVKVGVLGRTGSGKSTLFSSLLRAVEICDGEILLGRTNTRDLPLRDLRSRFSFVAQEPTLFDGTLRSNLDPFGEATSATLWHNLGLVGMRDRIASEPLGLEMLVQEGGTNFSLGQRQLLALARILTRRCSYVLMDEMSANIDHAMDRQIQKTWRRVFAHASCLVIAHRISTVVDLDKILVLRDGTVAEYDTPAALVARPDSLFRAMLATLGKEEETRLLRVIAARSKRRARDE